MKTICFLIPGRIDKPIGGHKVIYDYANKLSCDGYDVLIANNLFMPCNSLRLVELLRKVYAFSKYVYRSVTGRSTCRKWFNLNPRVKEIRVWTFDYQQMPPADLYIATAAVTAPYVLKYPVPTSHKIYFIQGYENWNMTDSELRATFRYPFTKIVISKWLASIVKEEGHDSILIPNGFNSEEFFCFLPIEHKDKYAISMLYHTMPSKNSQMAFEALDIVKAEFPQLHVNIFGVYDKPNLPEWYTYYKSPDMITHNRLNNESAIYIATSSSEGFGLTVGEAMMCGQAVACTDTKGYMEMAEDGVNALVSPIGDSVALAKNVITLINNDSLRIRIAANGLKSIAVFSADNSYKSLKSVVMKDNFQE